MGWERFPESRIAVRGGAGSAVNEFMQQYQSMIGNKLGCPIEKYDGESTNKFKEYVYTDLKNKNSEMKIYLFIL